MKALGFGRALFLLFRGRDQETTETERPREDAISLIRDLTVVAGSQGHRVTRVIKNFSRNNSRDYEIMSYLCVIILCDYEVLRNCGRALG